jgi:hypothetical protein
MGKQKHFYAWVQNKQGATMDAGQDQSSLSAMCAEVRARFGKGWTAHIMRVEIDGSSTEVKKFELRK